MNPQQMSLPYDFQEVLIWNEVELQSKISIKTIRKLVYIYTVSTLIFTFHFAS